MKKRVLSMILALVMLLSLLPAPALAAETAADIARLRALLEQQATEIHYNQAGITRADAFPVMMAAFEHTGVPTQGDYLRFNCEWATVDDGTGNLIYRVGYRASLREEDILTASLKALIKSFGFTAQTDDYTKIRTVYDYVCANTDYWDWDDLDCNAYDVLFGGLANDEAISALLYRMLLEAGIDNRVIRDSDGWVANCWNIVKLDGVYYHLDAARDAQSMEYQYFLLGDGSMDYTRSETYSSEEFYAAYPMSQTDYDCDRLMTLERPVYSDNRDGQYGYDGASYASSVVGSTLYEEDGNYIRVENIDGMVAVETYDSDFNFVSRKYLDRELSIYGGIYIGEDYNFMLTGQENPTEHSEWKVFRVTVYNKDWEFVRRMCFGPLNTTLPFRSGSLRCVEEDGTLFIRTSHRMFASSDGLNHQANMSLAFRISDLTMTDARYSVSHVGTGYVSHSFNQYIAADGETLVTLDHGDAYPRSVVLFTFSRADGSESFGRVSGTAEVLPITMGETGDNYTGVKAGGLAVSDTHYLTVGSSIVQEDCSVEEAEEQQNMYVTATPKDNVSTEATTIQWITDYTGTTIGLIHLVQIGANEFCLLWNTDDATHYIFLDGTGAATSEIYTTDALLSDCVPIVSGDSIVWYTTTGKTPFFYRMDLSNPGSVAEHHEHAYTSVITQPSCGTAGSIDDICDFCGDSVHLVDIPAFGHHYRSTVYEPTCDDDGYTTHTCVHCVDSYTDSPTAALGHDFEQVITEATCISRRTVTESCTRCSLWSRTTSGPYGDHTYENGVCIHCGEAAEVPAAPVVKGSNVASSGKIKLTWNAVSGAVSYKVYRATSKTGTYKLMKTVTSGTSYTNTSAVAGSTYYYYVVAIGEDGSPSEKSSIVTRTCDLPRPVVSISNVASSGKIKLTWDAVDGAVSYKVYRATSSGGTYTLLKTTTGTSFTNTSAKAGTLYYYKVVAVAEKSAANSAYSSYKSRTCDLPRPDVSIALKNGKPRLTWDKVDGAVSYKIYRATSKTGTYTLMKTTTGTSYTNTGAKSGVTYYYKVIAVHTKSAANSAYSLVDSIKSK